MISKDQFLELKHLKSLGVPTTTIAKKIGISVPNANKWLRLDDGFIALSKEMAKKHPVAVPENVETIRFTMIKEVFEDQKIESVGDGFATVLADIIVSPLIVVGQVFENATNSIQGLKNMSAKKKMAYLQYCMAILKYLENEGALVE